MTRSYNWLLVALLSFTSSGAVAMWAELSFDELVARSDLIVTGRFEGPVKPASKGDGPTVGAIKITSVLKGPPRIQSALIALPSPQAPISSSDIIYRPGQEGLWFLRRKEGGQADVYLADHPQRFVPSDRAGNMIDRVRQAVGPQR
jgi:hypothetical protein